MEAPVAQRCALGGSGGDGASTGLPVSLAHTALQEFSSNSLKLDTPLKASRGVSLPTLRALTQPDCSAPERRGANSSLAVGLREQVSEPAAHHGGAGPRAFCCWALRLRPRNTVS